VPSEAFSLLRQRGARTDPLRSLSSTLESRRLPFLCVCLALCGSGNFLMLEISGRELRTPLSHARPPVAESNRNRHTSCQLSFSSLCDVPDQLPIDVCCIVSCPFGYLSVRTGIHRSCSLHVSCQSSVDALTSTPYTPAHEAIMNFLLALSRVP